MPFVEAFRQFQFRVSPDNFMLVHVSLVIISFVDACECEQFGSRSSSLFNAPTIGLQATHPGQLPEPSKGEQKSKPTQHGVRELRGLGLSPDIVSDPILSR